MTLQSVGCGPQPDMCKSRIVLDTIDFHGIELFVSANARDTRVKISVIISRFSLIVSQAYTHNNKGRRAYDRDYSSLSGIPEQSSDE